MNRRGFLASLTAAGLKGAPAPVDAAPLYLLTYDHGGIILWGVEHFEQQLRDAMKWLDQYPNFKIGLDNEAYLYDYLAEQNPGLLEELRRDLQRYAGRLGIGSCTYGQPLMTFINEESNIRQIEYALAADASRLGVRPKIYLMSEHAMHSQMPQILAGLGFDGAILRTHFMMYGYNPNFDVAIGWWVGVDGSRIPAVPTYKGEGAEFGKTTTDNWVLTRCPGSECRGSLEEFREQFRHIQPLIATRADDAGLRREDLVRQTVGRPEYRWILLEELRAAFPAPSSEMHTAPDDFTVRMPWGYCGNEIWNRSREAEVSVLTAERLAAMEFLLGGSNREADLKAAWRNLLIAQHHDIQICGLTWEARKFLGDAISGSRKAAEQSLQTVAASMSAEGPVQITVFNPSSWIRRGWVEVEFPLPRHWGRAIDVRQGDQSIPCEILSAERASDESLEFVHLAIRAEAPPLGFAAYSLRPARGDAGGAPESTLRVNGLEITNPFWTLRLDRQGGVEGIVSRKTGRALLDMKSKRGLFAGTIDGRPCGSLGSWRVGACTPGAASVIARQNGLIGGIPYRFTWKISADSPRLDASVKFDFAGEKIGRLSGDRRDAHSPFVHEEKLRFQLFPSLGKNARGVRDLPFVVAETTNRYVEGNYWTAVADDRGGLAYLNRGTMGSVREENGAFSIPLAYSMFYVWGTRILSGEYSYEFAVVPFEGEWQAADLHRRALEYCFPLVAMAGAPGTGRLGNHVAMWEVGSPEVIASALYVKDGAALIRLCEIAGKTADAPIRYAAPGAKFSEVDLEGRPRQNVPSAAFRPWQIRTLRLLV